MAVLSFNQNNQIDDFSFVIVRKDNAALGSIKARDVNYKRNFNGADEVSLKVFKELNNNNQIWDRINDYNDLFVPELGDDGYFEMEVTVNEDTSGVYKTITATSRGESELSHTIIYNYEVNTEEEMENDEDWSAEYHTVFYRNLSEYKNQLDAAEEALKSTDPNSDGYAAAVDLYTKASTAYRKMKHVSLLHRVLDKLPNYSIGHVDDTLQQLTEWYQFSWDDKDVYSVLTGDIADQYHVYFNINSKRRTISAYDLFSVCNNDNCDYRLQMKADRNINTRYRGDYHHQCPICGSKDITEGYGKFTKIVVSKDNLSNSAQVSSNKDSLINCLKISGGDDDFDAAVMNQNPNGSQYIFQFSEENKVEMPPELVSKIDEYNEEYDKYYYGDEDSQKGIYTFTNQQTSKYDALIDFIDGNFKEETTEQYKPLNTKYVGYQSLAALYYNTLDLKAFYEYSMTPDVVTDNTSLDDTMALLTVGNLSPIAVINPKSSTQSTVENGILQSAKCIINTSLYDVTISPAIAATWTPATTDTGSGTWRGKLRVQTIEYKGTKYESINTKDTDTLTITVNYDMAKYVEQKIEKLTQRNKAQVKPLTDLTDIDQVSLNPDGSVNDNEADVFKERLHYYSLDILSKIIYPSYQDSMGIIVENSNRINELYYKLYNNRLKLIEEEIALREKQLADLQDVLDDINYYRSVTKVILNFELFLGEDLYKVFCNYRREDNYKNDNYISDDLNNNELMRRAGDLLDAAQKELYKLSHLQYNISGSLNNLLQLPAFAPIKDDFEVGNWINMLVDEKLYNLRLLSYSINFAELQTINVEFSTVEEIWSGATDIQSVLKQAGSMAGSYSAFQQQVRQQAPAAKRVQDWMNAGMDATAVRYVNNPMSQDIVYDSSGIVARGYDEISDSYTDNQLKIINNGLYLTQDNWDTISTGIGAFTYYDPETKEFVDDYGVIANTVVGKLFLGQNLKIYTGDGATDNRMIMDGDGLNVTNGTATVKINPNANNIFEILQGKTAKVKVDSSGNATFTGAVNATSLSTGSKTSAAGASGIYIDSSGNLSAGTSNQVKINANGTFTFGSGNSTINYNGSNLTFGSDVKIAWTSVTGTSNVASKSDIPTTAQITQITKDTVTTSYVNALNVKAGSVDAENISGTTITGKTLKGGSININDKFKVDSNGNATVSGVITATSGEIGGFQVDSTSIRTKNVAVTSNAANSVSLSSSTFTRTIGSTSRGSLKFAIGGNFGVANDGTVYAHSLKATNADLTGVITATSGTLTSVTVIDKLYTRTSSESNSTCFANAEQTNFSTTDRNYIRQHIIWARSESSPDVTRVSRRAIKLGSVDGFFSSDSSLASQFESGQSDECFSEYYSLNYIPTSGSKFRSFRVTQLHTDMIYSTISNMSIQFRSNIFLTVGTVYKQSPISLAPGGTYGANEIGYYTNNNNGKVGLLVQATQSDADDTHKGVYDATNSTWMIYSTSGSSAVKVGDAKVNTRLYGDNIYLRGTSTAVTSDERIKDDIQALNNSYELFFMNLSPRSYKMHNGTSGRLHIGYVAQEVESALIQSGISTTDFAGLVHDYGVDAKDAILSFKDGAINDESCYYLRYNEFIALNTYMIQNNYKHLSEHDKEIQRLKQEVLALQQELQALKA